MKKLGNRAKAEIIDQRATDLTGLGKVGNQLPQAVAAANKQTEGDAVAPVAIAEVVQILKEHHNHARDPLFFDVIAQAGEPCRRDTFGPGVDLGLRAQLWTDTRLSGFAKARRTMGHGHDTLGVRQFF
jgi:hypothetical protein